MSITIDGGEFPTISAALSAKRVVSIALQKDGKFCIEEGCDGYYAVTLTPEQLIAWADEIKALAQRAKVGWPT